MGTSMSTRTSDPGPSVLVEALPYIRRFAGAVVVVKYGGNAMDDGALGRAVRRGHRADAGRRPAPRRRPRRRAPDQRPDGAAGQGARVPRRPAGHRRRDRRHRPHGPASARSTATSCASINVHGPLAVGVSGEDAGLIVASARPRARLRGRRRRRQPGDPRAAARRGPHPGPVHDRHRPRRAGLQHQRRHRRRRHRRGARAPRRSSTSPTSRACSRDVADPASLISRITAADLQALDRRRPRSPAG